MRPEKMASSRGVGEEAVDAGMEILKLGGNAIDAGVATTFALSVTDAKLFCFGGEVPIMIYDRNRKVVEVLSGQGVAPKLATQERFQSTVPGRIDIPAEICSGHRPSRAGRLPGRPRSVRYKDVH